MKSILFFLIFSSNSFSQEAFRDTLKGMIQRDPEFKEVDLEKPFYEAKLNQGFSKLILPKVDLSYGYYQQNRSSTLNFNEDNYKIGTLNASLDIFSFGSDWNSFQSARLQKRALTQRIQTRLLGRESELAGLLLDYLRDARNVDILGRLLELKERALEVSKRRFERGNLSEEDYSKVKLDVSNARAELVVATQAFNNLKARVHSYGVENMATTWPWEKVLDNRRIEAISSMSVPVQDLPQYQELYLLEEANSYERAAARGDMLGKVALNFSRSLYDFADRNQWEWRVGLAYTLPLFDQFDQYVSYRRRDITLNVSELRSRLRQKQSHEKQLADSENLKLSWKNWMERQEALKISSRLYNRSVGQFNQGQLSVNELFVDQDRLLRTEQIANLALHQLHESVLAFCHSRGMAYIQECF